MSHYSEERWVTALVVLGFFWGPLERPRDVLPGIGTWNVPKQHLVGNSPAHCL